MSHQLRRRSFLASAVAAPASKPLAFAAIADVHHGLMPDAHARLERFFEAVQQRQPDFVVQLGDFCHPVAEAGGFLKTWHSYRGAKHNVLGNHDMDFGAKADIMDRLEMNRAYYSFDAGGFHFVILDCNYLHREGRFTDFAHGNYFGQSDYRDWVSQDQVEWLKADLAASRLPGIVFTHQPVQGYWDLPAPERRANVRGVFSRANRRRSGSVVACLSGHEHVDAHRCAGDIDYLIINSASYYWVGEEYGRLAQYRDPLWAFVTIENGVMTVEGRSSGFIPPSPRDRKHPNGDRVTASIANRRISLNIPRP